MEDSIIFLDKTMKCEKCGSTKIEIHRMYIVAETLNQRAQKFIRLETVSKTIANYYYCTKCKTNLGNVRIVTK